jgi:hypothetical protein
MPLQNTIDLPSGRRSQLFRALADLLENDPELARVVKTFRSWKGGPQDAAAPTVAQLPWVRITPTKAPADLTAVGLQQSDIFLNIEVYTPGLLVENMLDLWEQIEATLFPGDTTVMQLLLANQGLGTLSLQSPAFGLSELDSSQIFTALGVLRVGFVLQTKL